MRASTLFPEMRPFRTHWMAASGGHRLCVEEFGCEHGLPALVLHGGPGSGCSPLLRRFFDPERFRVVCLDQRGAGRSQPRGGTENNTTADLLADLRSLRRALGIDRWLVAGGSWGATLALLHARDAPDAISGLLLRSTFLARRADIDAFFANAPAPLRADWHRLGALPDVAQRELALAWWHWEQAACGTASRAALPDALSDAAALDSIVARYRVQSHYLANACFLTEPLLDTAARLPQTPTLLLHGCNDFVCPVEGATRLQQRMPNALLRRLEAVGHDPSHPAMVAAMRRGLDAFASTGGFAS